MVIFVSDLLRVVANGFTVKWDELTIPEKEDYITVLVKLGHELGIKSGEICEISDSLGSYRTLEDVERLKG